ncbi:MAG: hypothetical protein ACJLS2_04885 [Microcella pacifica]
MGTEIVGHCQVVAEDAVIVHTTPAPARLSSTALPALLVPCSTTCPVLVKSLAGSVNEAAAAAGAEGSTASAAATVATIAARGIQRAGDEERAMRIPSPLVRATALGAAGAPTSDHPRVHHVVLRR